MLSVKFVQLKMELILSSTWIKSLQPREIEGVERIIRNEDFGVIMIFRKWG
jgi:hypothetical protein